MLPETRRLSILKTPSFALLLKRIGPVSKKVDNSSTVSDDIERSSIVPVSALISPTTISLPVVKPPPPPLLLVVPPPPPVLHLRYT